MGTSYRSRLGGARSGGGRGHDVFGENSVREKPDAVYLGRDD